MSFEITDRITPATLARITGGLYLAFMAASVLADVFGHIRVGNAQHVYEALNMSPSLFKLGLVIAFVSAFLFLMAAWGLFVLLRKVNDELALLFLLLNAVGVAMQCASQLALVSAMFMAESATGSPSFIHLSINVYEVGTVTAQLFFGTWLFPLGYLVFASGFLPRVLGVLLILDGVAELIWFLQVLLLPQYPVIRVPGTYVSVVAEVGLALWLLVMGVRVAGRRAGQPPAAAAFGSDGDGSSA